MWVKLIPAIFLGLVIIATVVVRFTPTESDDKVVGKIQGHALALLHRFPTIGLNPKTKALQEVLEALTGVETEEVEGLPNDLPEGASPVEKKEEPVKEKSEDDKATDSPS